LLAFFANFKILLPVLRLRSCAKLLALELTDALELRDSSEGGFSGEIFLFMGSIVLVLDNVNMMENSEYQSTYSLSVLSSTPLSF